MNDSTQTFGARLRRRALAVGLFAATLGAPALADGGTYLESNGLVVILLESRPTVGAWTFSTQTPNWTGDGYIRWDGADLFQAPGAQGVFAYDIQINTPGTYKFNLRNRHEDPNPTEDNDVWVKMDNGPWEKIFSNGASSVGNWTWEARVELGPGNFPQKQYSLSAGMHRLQFSGRSNGFKMDRLHLAIPGAPNEFNLSAPESDRRIGSTYGNAVANSTGAVGLLEAFGSGFASQNEVELRASRLPQSTLGIFLVSDSQTFIPNLAGTVGNVLVGPNAGRYAANIVMTDAQGRVSFSPDMTQIPQGSGFVSAAAGDTWNFQLWHRDSVNGTSTSNLTRAVSITFD
ncbi:MAG: hypothetical protein R3F49_11370 [Planctomycetota bacterium]